MLSTVVSFVFGFLAALGGVFFFLFRWNPRGALDGRRHRRHQQRVKRPIALTPAEARQAALFALHGGSVESAVWLNAILGYVFGRVASQLNEQAADGRLEDYINANILSKIDYPNFVSPVLVSDLSIGASLPTVQSVRVLQADPAKPLVFDVAVSYDGSAFVCVETGFGLNAPIVNLAVLPIELALKSLRLEFALRVQLDVSELPSVALTVGLLAEDPQPLVDFDIHTHIGSELILSDLHIIQTIFQRVLQEVLEEKLIEPNSLQFDLKLW